MNLFLLNESMIQFRLYSHEMIIFSTFCWQWCRFQRCKKPLVSDFVVNVVSDFAQWNGCLIQQLSNAIIMHVEVQDYGIACIARVSSLSQKFLVIGMLGDWWVLYSSSSSISGFSIGSWFPVLPSDYWWRMQIKKGKTWKHLSLLEIYQTGLYCMKRQQKTRNE